MFSIGSFATRVFAVALCSCAFVGRATAQARGDTLTLPRLLDAALASHPRFRALRAQAVAAAAERDLARALPNPVVSYQREHARDASATVPAMDAETMTLVTLPLESLYQRGPRGRDAEASWRAATADLDGARTRLLRDVAERYYDAVLAQAQADALADVAQWLDSFVVLMRHRVTEGAAAPAELLRTELERDRLVAETSVAESERARMLALLRPYLRAGTASPARVAEPVEAYLALPFADANAAAVAAIAQRPEATAARARAEAAQARRAVERSMVVPQLGAGVGLKSVGGGTSLVTALSLPLPIGNHNGAGIARAKADADALIDERDATVADVRAEAMSAWFAARTLTDRAASLLPTPDRPGTLGRAEDARRIASAAYREGAGTVMQVLDAARAATEASLALYRTLVAQHRGVLALLAATGADLGTALPPLLSSARSGSAR